MNLHTYKLTGELCITTIGFFILQKGLPADSKIYYKYEIAY